ncbi:hypothetical protein DICPUDRAFT_94802 [Dictyostelium purpureum]|uniref:Neutral ceramidase n=1 Tax=Dictyostelium purpureum TaxID=5786 RepID=F0ZNN0_DICPU|nr:uncharacterized protein DICPUDRAFT_94802 [Dictyostelium purpureum]EGC34439.1 hypothetical protein DICPUDRAFT_94802 [Dictyostelium purpureum]|eukprot:XP_003289024.1 hypothetical protein DICPUDRAFT_94802 [Dictyostelium purpureum]
MFIFFFNHIKFDDSSYQIGTGIYDITGPAAETGMMGYAMPGQITGGLHFRLRARAFVFVDSNGNRAVYVSTDSCMIFQAVKIKVIQDLQAIFGENVYSHENVLLSGTHTHSGPGGYSMYALYGITTLGFYEDNFNTIVDGIVQAIVRAHKSVAPARMLAQQGELLESNINRSPTAYQNNPEEEKALYDYDVDKNMTVIRIEDLNGNPVAAMSFFAVHCTSMNNTNHLISGDNKGYASYMWEKYQNGNSTLPGQGPFIASFGQSNEGDVSPNTKGAFCPDGTPCVDSSSTCNGKNEGCKAIGPGKNGDMFESTQIIGTNQFKKALELFENASIPVQGPIQYRHSWVQMTNISVQAPFNNGVEGATTCRAAMGYSFAAGTTDGPGAFDFTQGDNSTSGNIFWNFISKFIAVPTEDQKQCQSPKPILIDVGLTKPYPWTPDVLPVQIITIGQIVLVAVPGEFTTMSGRRLRNTVREVIGQSIQDPIVLVAGLANTYSGYIATYEEYETQRYEGASTIFGPHTLGGYQQEFAKLAQSIVDGTEVDPGTFPRNLTGHTLFFLPPVIFDEAPSGDDFGKIYTDAQESYSVGSQASVVFYGANPRNNFMIESSFLTVDQYVNNQWVTVLNDGDWDTKFIWKMHNLAQSLITIEWNIDPSTQPGTYRITHTGYAKKDPISKDLTQYLGVSRTFTVTN